MLHSTKNDHYWLFWCQKNWALEAVDASEVAEAAEVNEVGVVFKALKITTESSRCLNPIILGLISFHFAVLKKKIF